MRLEDYEIDTRTYDETFESGDDVKKLYRKLLTRFSELNPQEIEQHHRLIKLLLRNQNVTFTIYSNDTGIEKMFPFDPIPRLISAKKWSKIKRRLVQRVQTLNLFLTDIYNPQRILNDQMIPTKLIYRTGSFRRKMVGMTPPQNIYTHVLHQLARIDIPPILLVQHITRDFTTNFRSWLNEATNYPMVIAKTGIHLASSTIYLAPEDHHLDVTSDTRILLTNDPPARLFRPSSDYLLGSLAAVFRRTAADVILSGINNDTTRDALELAAANGIVVAQDTSAAINSIPQTVRQSVPSTRVLSLDAIPSFLTSLSKTT